MREIRIINKEMYHFNAYLLYARCHTKCFIRTVLQHISETKCLTTSDMGRGRQKLYPVILTTVSRASQVHGTMTSLCVRGSLARQSSQDSELQLQWVPVSKNEIDTDRGGLLKSTSGKHTPSHTCTPYMNTHTSYHLSVSLAVHKVQLKGEKSKLLNCFWVKKSLLSETLWCTYFLEQYTTPRANRC